MGRALVIGGANFSSNYIDIIDIDGGTTYYNVTTSLTGYSLGSYSSSVVAGGTFSATLSVESGYTAGSVTIYMGDTNITSSAYNATSGAISIPTVTGDVQIRAIAVRDAELTTWIHGLDAQTISSKVNRNLSSAKPLLIYNVKHYRGRQVEKVKFYCNAAGTLTFYEMEIVDSATSAVVRTLGSVTTTSAEVGTVVTKNVSFTVPSENEFGLGCDVVGVLMGNNTTPLADSVVPLKQPNTFPIGHTSATAGKDAAVFWDALIDFYATDTPLTCHWFLGLSDFSQCQQALNSSSTDCWFVDAAKSIQLQGSLVRKVKFKAGEAGTFVLCYDSEQETSTKERALANITVSASEAGTVVEKDVLFTIPNGYIGLYNNPNGVLMYIYNTSLTSYQLQLVNPSNSTAMAGRDAYFDLFVV